MFADKSTAIEAAGVKADPETGACRRLVGRINAGTALKARSKSNCAKTSAGVSDGIFASDPYVYRCGGFIEFL